MKTIQMPKELQPLLKCAEASEQDTVVFTDNKRPVAALVSLRKVDRESLALSTNPQFWKIMGLPGTPLKLATLDIQHVTRFLP